MLFIPCLMLKTFPEIKTVFRAEFQSRSFGALGTEEKTLLLKAVLTLNFFL